MTSPDRVPEASRTHVERLSPPAAWHLTSVLTGASAGLVVLPLSSTPVALAVGIVVAVITSALLVATAPVVRVHEGTLTAGEAHIPLALLGEPEELDAEATRRALGPELDARAFVVLRAWCRTTVRVPVTDPADPTPYWLVSTRRPADLARSLRG